MSIYRCHNLLLFWFLLAACAMHYVNGRQDNIGRLNCAADFQNCQAHGECCSRQCMTHKCGPSVEQKYPYGSRSGHNNLELSVGTNRHLQDDELEFIPLKDDINEYNSQSSVEKASNAYEITNLPIADPTESRTCRLVGDACSDSRECCTKRCHTYLHKCVT